MVLVSCLFCTVGSSANHGVSIPLVYLSTKLRVGLCLEGLICCALVLGALSRPETIIPFLHPMVDQFDVFVEDMVSLRLRVYAISPYLLFLEVLCLRQHRCIPDCTFIQVTCASIPNYM